MKTVVQGHAANFETLQRAFAEGNVCLMECTDVVTSEKVAIICAININGEYEMVPMAMFFNENPYKRYTPPMEAPRYEHDCQKCEFLGQYKEYDLYFCPNEPTIIARYSDEGGDYGSGLVFGVTSDKGCYREALVRALQTEHKQEIVEYFEKCHSSMGDRLERFQEILLISETDPKDYPKLIGSLKYFSSYIEEHFKGEKSNETSN